MINKTMIKMVKYCPRCGYPNPDDALFCVKCGYQFPQQPSNPPNTPNYQPPKSHIMAIIGGIIAVVIILIAIVVILPLLSTHASALYSPSQASSNFGGSWTLCKNKTGVIYHTSSQYCIKFCNGTTMKESYPSLFGSSFSSSSIQMQCVAYFTSANFEILNSSNNGQPISLEIGILHYDNNTIPSAIFNKLRSFISFFGALANASVVCAKYNGFNIVYVGTSSSTSPNVEEKPGAMLIACGNNELVIIELNGEYASQYQMENVLSAIT